MNKHWVCGIICCGAFLRLALGLSTMLHPSAELNLIQGDNSMRAGDYLLRHGDIPDPVFVPGYIYLCALVINFFSGHAVLALLTLQWILAVICIPLAMYLGRKFGGPRCGVVFGLFVAFDPLLLIQSSLMLTEAVYIPLLFVAAVLFVKVFDFGLPLRRSLPLLGLCGLTIGLCTLTRSIGLFVVPIMLFLLWMEQSHTPLFRGVSSVALLAPVMLLLLPLCLHNQTKYGHFNISSSGKFNIAALVIGPTKKAFDKNTSPELLDMWAQELGPQYRRKPPFVLADDASKVALAWAKNHPLMTLGGLVKGQLLMIVAPERTSWAAGLAWLDLSPHTLGGINILISLFRLTIAAVALAGLCFYRNLIQNRRLLVFFVLLILCHMILAGAAGAGRFIAPVVPYIDLIASLTLLRFAQRKAPRSVGMTLHSNIE